MNQRRFFIISAICLLTLTLHTYTQYGPYTSRSLLEKEFYFVANGKIERADYWALHVGKFDCVLKRPFPGEGEVSFDASLNFNLLSSGYIEGTGYGTRGKAGAEAQLAIMDADTIKTLEPSEVEYVYQSGEMIKVKNRPACPLIVYSETNKMTIRRMKIMIWIYDKKYNELKHLKDVDEVTAFSYTKEGAYKALQANKASPE